MSKGHHGTDNAIFLRQFPGRNPVWGRCQFSFDLNDPNYDWLVCYDDLAPSGNERFSGRIEDLMCAPDHTMLITMEPSSIKIYGHDFLDQFGIVLTSQEPWVVRSPGTVFRQPALRWYYGVSETNLVDWDTMNSRPPLEKTRDLATVCSNKRHGCTLHARRFDFTAAVSEAIPEMEVFGRGRRPIDDKADAIDPYKYHLAIENHLAEHHWTEKLSDAFLGAALPFYVGCPNADDYFPADSFIPLNIYDVEGSIQTIKDAIENNEYEKRLPAILEARRRVLHHYNLFAEIASLIESSHDESAECLPGTKLYSRHAIRKRGLGYAVRFAVERFTMMRKSRNLVRAMDRRAVA